LAEFLVRLAEERDKEPVLIATTDGTALYTLHYQDRLKGRVRLTSESSSATSTLIDKSRFYKVAEELGIAHPRTFVVSTGGDASAAAGEIGFPCMLKPALSHLFAASYGTKCFVITGKESLESAWRRVEGAEIPMLVQEIIPGRQIYMWYGYYSRRSELMAYCGYQKVRQYPPNFGCGCLVSARIETKMIEAADMILKHIGYQGICEPEFKYDSRQDCWKILEINARTSTQNRLPAALGTDMEYLAYLEAIGRLPTEPKVGNGRMIWSESHKDFASALADGRMTFKNWLASRRGAKVYAFFAWDDPLPAVARLPEAATAVLGTICRRWCPGLYRFLKKKISGHDEPGT